jgi:hypothetical protein
MVSIQRRAIVAGVSILAAFFLVACGGGEEPPPKQAVTRKGPETPPDPRPRIERGDDGEIRYSGETNTGESFKAQLGGEVELPAAFPKDIPIFPDAVLFSAMETGGGTAIVSLDSEAQPPAIYDFYKQKLEGAAWRIENEAKLGGGRVVTATKGDRKVVLNIERTEKGSRFGFMVGPAG